jgi:hypothetical protein
LMGSGLLSMVHFLASMLRSRKVKGHFPARQWSSTLSPVSQPNDKVIVQGILGQSLGLYFTWPLA